MFKPDEFCGFPVARTVHRWPTQVSPKFGSTATSWTCPTAAVVDLGCGLDRLVGDVGAEDGGASVYALDFPEVLRLRRTWMGVHERERELPFSLTDHRWMDEVDASGGLIAVELSSSPSCLA